MISSNFRGANLGLLTFNLILSFAEIIQFMAFLSGFCALFLVNSIASHTHSKVPTHNFHGKCVLDAVNRGYIGLNLKS